MLVFLFRLLSRFVLVARLWSQDRQNITWAVIALTSFGMHCITITCFCPIENSLSILVVYIHLTICVSSNGIVLLRDITLLSYFFVKKYLLVGASGVLWTGQWVSESVSEWGMYVCHTNQTGSTINSQSNFFFQVSRGNLTLLFFTRE